MAVLRSLPAKVRARESSWKFPSIRTASNSLPTMSRLATYSLAQTLFPYSHRSPLFNGLRSWLSTEGECMRGVSGTQLPHSFDRRALLKSAAGAFIGASALHIGSETAFAQKSSSQREDSNSGHLRQQMLGFMLPHEQFPVPQLIEFGIAAEAAGFDLLATSDHFQPWQSNEGHSGEAWVTMGVLGARTRRVWIGPTVTCPTFRYNPAVVAEAF